jgi:hypothetical protein
MNPKMIKQTGETLQIVVVTRVLAPCSDGRAPEVDAPSDSASRCGFGAEYYKWSLEKDALDRAFEMLSAAEQSRRTQAARVPSSEA